MRTAWWIVIALSVVGCDDDSRARNVRIERAEKLRKKALVDQRERDDELAAAQAIASRLQKVSKELDVATAELAAAQTELDRDTARRKVDLLRAEIAELERKR